jgi:hypothetical protein
MCRATIALRHSSGIDWIETRYRYFNSFLIEIYSHFSMTTICMIDSPILLLCTGQTFDIQHAALPQLMLFQTLGNLGILAIIKGQCF